MCGTPHCGINEGFHMRVLFALPGLHRLDRGAELAFIAIASELAKAGDSVTLVGSGNARAKTPYRFLHAASIPRQKFEHFPSIPVFRNECAYEELTFLPEFLRRYRPADYDVTITCSYPFSNWALRRPVARGTRPPHVFVTQNGDWPATARVSEFRFFGCDGLVCTNPEFYERQKHRWRCRLIPNGVDCNRFGLGEDCRKELGFPTDRLIILMVSALIASKRVAAGIDVVSHIPDAHLVVLGDGPLRQEIDNKAARLIPGRFQRLSLSPDKMPMVYRSADVFLHLSKEEPSSLAFLEALACGLPVVAHDYHRLRWLAGDDAFLLDTDDLAAVAQHIELTRESSPIQRKKRSSTAAKFSWENIGAQYRAFLQEIVASS
jgi:glycosyltransferase involved in cell wall biosynthesis